MWAIAKSVMLVARYFRRIALALEAIRELYELDLASRGIVRVDPNLRDEVEITYGVEAVGVDGKGGRTEVEEEW